MQFLIQIVCVWLVRNNGELKIQDTFGNNLGNIFENKFHKIKTYYKVLKMRVFLWEFGVTTFGYFFYNLIFKINISKDRQ